MIWEHEIVEVELGMYRAMTVPGRRTESAVHITVQLLPHRRHAAQIKEGCIGQIPDYLSTGIFVLSTKPNGSGKITF